MNRFTALRLGVLILTALYGSAPAQDADSLTLSEAIRAALDNNLDLRRSSNQIASGKTTLDQALAAFYPSLSAALSSSRDFRKGGGDNSDQSGASVRGSLSSSLNLFNGFGDVATYERARLEYSAAAKNHDYQRQATILAALNGFIDIVAKGELIDIEEQNLSAQRLQLERIEAFYNAGNRPISDLLQQRADISQAELNLLTAHRDYQVSQYQFLKLLGKEPSGGLKFIAPPLETIIPQISVPDTNPPLDLLLTRRSDMAAQLLHKQALAKDIRAAHSSLLPSAALSASVGSSYLSSSPAAGFTEQFLNDNPSLGIGLTVSIPLFDRFQTKTNVEQARIRLSDQELQLADLRLDIRLELEQALLDWETAVKQRETAQAQLQFAEQALDASQARYDVGAATYTELSQVRAQYLTAANNRVQAGWNLLLKYAAVSFYRGDIDAAVHLFN